MLTGRELDQAIEVARLTYQNPEPIIQEFASLKEAKKDVTDKMRAQWLIEHANDHQELAAAVVQNINKDVLAHMFALSFLQDVTLGSDEWPILTTDVRDRNYETTYIGEDGSPKQKTRVPRRTHLSYLLNLFSTQNVDYPIRSLQIGDVNEVDRVQRELSYEIRLGIDDIARALLDASVLASGLRATFNLHPSIIVDNIPDKNYYDESGSDTGILTIAKLKNILDYFVRFANDVELDGAALTINTIYMSSRQIRNIWDFVNLVAGYAAGGSVITDPKDAVPSGVKEGIFRSGKLLTAIFGYSVNFVARNTIELGDMYVSTNKPAGFNWRKPSYDQVVVDNSADMRRMNRNAMSMERCFAMAIPEEWTYRFLKVKV